MSDKLGLANGSSDRNRDGDGDGDRAIMANGESGGKRDRDGAARLRARCRRGRPGAGGVGTRNGERSVAFSVGSRGPVPIRPVIPLPRMEPCWCYDETVRGGREEQLARRTEGSGDTGTRRARSPEPLARNWH